MKQQRLFIQDIINFLQSALPDSKNSGIINKALPSTYYNNAEWMGIDHG